MTATNHVTTGALFATATINVLPWWLVLPLAFCLHFLLDALPHFGDKDDPGKSLHRLRWLLPLDAFVAAMILLVIFLLRPEQWPVIIASGVLCASPDLWSAKRYALYLKSGDISLKHDWFAQFHHNIQHYERPWGAWVEGFWFAGVIGLLWQAIG